MRNNVRTDLAIEARELYQETAAEQGEIPGVTCEETGDARIRITRVQVKTQEGEQAIGKRTGTYVTIEMPDLRGNDPSLYKDGAAALAQELKNIIGPHKLTLVAGLGNDRITPDALGPKVVASLVVTRHLFEQMPESVGDLSPVCAIAPGVLGLTGIETGEIIRGVAMRVKPDLVIAVDALAARSTARVATTVQIADTGISPGSGVGNSRKAIDADTLGVPVIAIGVPMVVDAATIAGDTISLVMDTLTQSASGEFYKLLQQLNRNEQGELIRGSLPLEMQAMMVTPKDVDALADNIAHLVALGINQCLHARISQEELMTLTN